MPHQKFQSSHSKNQPPKYVKNLSAFYIRCVTGRKKKKSLEKKTQSTETNNKHWVYTLASKIIIIFILKIDILQQRPHISKKKKRCGGEIILDNTCKRSFCQFFSLYSIHRCHICMISGGQGEAQLVVTIKTQIHICCDIAENNTSLTYMIKHFSPTNPSHRSARYFQKTSGLSAKKRHFL